MQILGLEKVRIMRFLGRKGELEGVFVGIRSRRKGQRRAAMGTIGSRNDARKVHRGRRREGERTSLLKRRRERRAKKGADEEDEGRAEGEERADDTIVLKKKKEEKESRVKKIADTIGTKNIKYHFIGRKTPENLHICKKKCTFAR